MTPRRFPLFPAGAARARGGISFAILIRSDLHAGRVSIRKFR